MANLISLATPTHLLWPVALFPAPGVSRLETNSLDLPAPSPSLSPFRLSPLDPLSLHSHTNKRIAPLPTSSPRSSHLPASPITSLLSPPRLAYHLSPFTFRVSR